MTWLTTPLCLIYSVLTLVFIFQHMGSREDVASRIEADTKAKIDEMTKQVNAHKEHVSRISLHTISIYDFTNCLFLIQVISKVLELLYDIKPELHKNFKAIK